ncbi:lipase family protein [Nitrosomonas communis]|uniref:lipase family protein n=1 Tax=Nitrosomonas communis TaxID=44574 RepID=UPI0026EBCE05|nr:lipase family protein [Nitrosomonas communis]MCO6428011.1 lipase family protein [Nitrosomonas communis]
MSSNAGYADFDINTAYRLAVASKCSYATEENKKSVNDCFSEEIRNSGKEGKEVLSAFKDLPNEKIEVFISESNLAANKAVNTAIVAAKNLAGKKENANDTEINAAILVQTGNDVIIAFRGTNPTPQDWMNNFLLTSVEDVSNVGLYKDGRHYGFDQSLKTLTEKIKNSEIWKSLLENPSRKTLYLTGHSKGGALAAGATVDYQNDFSQIETYTFEAARFFTAQGENDHKSQLDRLQRFEYQYDIVPHLPLGKVTYDFMLKNVRYITLLESIFSIPNNEKIKNWIEKVKTNNINFVPVGQLIYVGSDNKCYKQSDKIDPHEYYRKRFMESVEKNGSKTLNDFIENIFEKSKSIFAPEKIEAHSPLSFLIDQHNEGHLRFLKNAVENISKDKEEKHNSNCDYPNVP